MLFRFFAIISSLNAGTCTQEGITWVWGACAEAEGWQARCQLRLFLVSGNKVCYLLKKDPSVLSLEERESIIDSHESFSFH